MQGSKVKRALFVGSIYTFKLTLYILARWSIVSERGVLSLHGKVEPQPWIYYFFN